MNGAAWSPDEEAPMVGVVDDESTAAADRSALVESLAPALADGDASSVAGSLDDVLAAEPTLLVAAGESALSAVARSGTAAPVLPVGDVAGIESVAPEALPAALEGALAGEAVERRRPVLGVDLEDGDRTRALFDVTLVTDEPARISEYSVLSREERVATFRADGVVVATPAGSHGYAGAVEAPVLSAAVDAVAVAPIGPFATRTRRWVLPDDGVVLAVERDEGDVALVADDRPVGPVSVGSPVSVGVDGALSTLVVPDERLADE